MRRIEPTSTFKRDYKRVKATPKHRDIDSLLPEVLRQLAIDLALPERNRDHSLTGDWKDHRDCHVKPDLVLIYRKQMMKYCSLFGSVHMPNWVYDKESKTDL